MEHMVFEPHGGGQVADEGCLHRKDFTSVLMIADPMRCPVILSPYGVHLLHDALSFLHVFNIYLILFLFKVGNGV